MEIQLTKDDCSNVQLALISLAKAANVNDQAMEGLLRLSKKFHFKEEIPPGE